LNGALPAQSQLHGAERQLQSTIGLSPVASNLSDSVAALLSLSNGYSRITKDSARPRSFSAATTIATNSALNASIVKVASDHSSPAIHTRLETSQNTKRALLFFGFFIDFTVIFCSLRDNPVF
jgi:hypothetical protein